MVSDIEYETVCAHRDRLVAECRLAAQYLRHPDVAKLRFAIPAQVVAVRCERAIVDADEREQD